MEELINKLFDKVEMAVTFSGISFGISIMVFCGFLVYLMIKEAKDE